MLLCAGTYGIVYLAEDTTTHMPRKRVAIKVIRLSPAQLGVFGNAERIYREAQILRRLKHPNIVNMINMFVTE